MYSYLKGKLVEKNPSYAVIECQGVGYMIHISLNTYSKIKDEEQCKLFTHLVVREDLLQLIGFATQEERLLFRYLISVKGVGVNTARIILSSLSPVEVTQAILSEDIETLKQVKGIGPKAAKQIILDLKDKLSKEDFAIEKVTVVHNSIKNEALSGLTILGFPKNIAEKALKNILASTDDDLSVEELIKRALKVL